MPFVSFVFIQKQSYLLQKQWNEFWIQTFKIKKELFTIHKKKQYNYWLNSLAWLNHFHVLFVFLWIYGFNRDLIVNKSFLILNICTKNKQYNYWLNSLAWLNQCISNKSADSTKPGCLVNSYIITID